MLSPVDACDDLVIGSPTIDHADSTDDVRLKRDLGAIDHEIAGSLFDLVLDHVEGRELDEGIDSSRRIFPGGETMPGVVTVTKPVAL